MTTTDPSTGAPATVAVDAFAQDAGASAVNITGGFDRAREPASVYAALASSAARWPQATFLVVPPAMASLWQIPAGEISYSQALATTDALCRRYAGLGLKAGERAGLLLGNRPAFFWHWLALNALGVSVVPINGEFRHAELVYLIGDAGLSLCVADVAEQPRLQRAADAAGRSLLMVEPGAEESGVNSRGADNRGNTAVPVGTLHAECALLYTSGTTGQPKGCILPNEYFVYAGAWYRDLGGLCALRVGEDRLLSPLPLTHMNAMACSSMAMLMTGGAIILVDRFHPSTWWQTVREMRATIIHYLGVMPAMLIGAPPDAGDCRHAVRFGFGAGVDRRHHAAFEARFGFPLVEGWAMTETGAGGCIMANHEPRQVGSNCFGRPPRWVDWRIVDESGNDCAVDVPGELLVRRAGPSPDFGFFKGYLNKPEATHKAWAGGWFHTGDVVRIDAEGAMHFVDRRKNVIRRSGENIAAVEVEGVLMQHALVAGVGVAPVPDAVRGDEVMACVVLKPGVSPDESCARELVGHCLQSLAYFKAPGHVRFVAQLPLTPTQKIQRTALRELAMAGLEPGASACFDLRALKRRDAHG